MERRKFIIGAGALATSSAAAMGTGAFSSMSAERGTTVDVVDDTDGLISLQSNIDSDTVEVDSDSGEWTLDLSAGDSGGINTNSEYVFGGGLRVSETEPPESSPLIITNNDSEEREITLTYELDDNSWVNDGAVEDSEWGGGIHADSSYIQIELFNSRSHGRGNMVVPADEDEHYGRQIAGPLTTSLSSGDSRWAVITVNTEDAEDYDEEDLSGTLSISAE